LGVYLFRFTYCKVVFIYIGPAIPLSDIFMYMYSFMSMFGAKLV